MASIKPADPADPTPSTDKPDETIHTDLPQVDTPRPVAPSVPAGEPAPSGEKRKTLHLPVKTQ